MAEIDDIDREILRILQDNARTTAEQMATHINLSAPACQRRMKRLRDERIITHEVAVVTPQRGARHTTLVVEITLEGGGADKIDAFRQLMRETPEVQQCFYVTGETDFVLIINVEDMAAYERLTRRIYLNNPDIRRFETMACMEIVKQSLAIPV